jgi:hypothetical protein
VEVKVEVKSDHRFPRLPSKRKSARALRVDYRSLQVKFLLSNESIY